MRCLWTGLDQSVDSDHWPKFDLLELSYLAWSPTCLPARLSKPGALGTSKRTMHGGTAKSSMRGVTAKSSMRGITAKGTMHGVTQLKRAKDCQPNKNSGTEFACMHA